MMKVDKINSDVTGRFAALFRREKLAHAYLFIGPKDIGKGETAITIAKLVNCEQGGGEQVCDSCPSCVKIDTGNHPDLTIIDNGYGEPIKIEEMRDVLNKNKLRPFLAKKKVIIIKNIENMTLQSANAFLKTLEEPTADTLLLLTTSVPEQNLDTIRSRCHAVFFPTASSNELEGLLREDPAFDEIAAHVLAHFAQGCPGTARRLKDDGFVVRKNEIVDGFILNRPDDAGIKALIADKPQTKEFLDILSSWIRDSLLLKTGVEDERLVHLDRKNELHRFAQTFSFDDLNELNQSAVRMRQLLADNLNIKLPLLIIGEQIWAT